MDGSGSMLVLQNGDAFNYMDFQETQILKLTQIIFLNVNFYYHIKI